MGVRLWVMVRQPNELLRQKLAAYKVVGMGDNRLTVAAIKVTADGALGSRGAWMLEPYADSPGSTGLATTPIESITETAKIAMENGVQLCIHCIGDRANREVLNVYEAAFKANPDKKDHRWRIEHAQHLSAADIPRFGQLGVIASMQGIHATSDAPYVPARLGEKRAEEGAYVWQKLMKSGAIVSNGTDTPVEAIDPIPNFYALVTRKTKDGMVFYGDQKMTRAEALKAYTYNAAFAAKEEAHEGVARSRQARRHHGAVEGHHDRAGRRDPVDPGDLHDRRRQGRVQEITASRPRRAGTVRAIADRCWSSSPPSSSARPAPASRDRGRSR